MRPIYRTDGKWVAVLADGYLYDTLGEWIAWLHGNEVYSLEGEYVGYLSQDSRILRARKYEPRPKLPVPPRPFLIRVPSTVPLPPLFAELGYDTIDVFQESPDWAMMISERKPDLGEEQYEPKISRINQPPPEPEPQPDRPPPAAEEKRTVRKLPPRQPQVPTDDRPKPEIKAEVKPSVQPPQPAPGQLSDIEREILDQMVEGLMARLPLTKPPFPIEDLAAGRQPDPSNLPEPVSPEERVRLAEGVVEQMGRSAWVQKQGYCGEEGFSPRQVAYVVRCLLMPEKWVRETPRRLKRDWALARRFRVPEELVHQRLTDLDMT